jgi:hypothetical protein
MEAVLRAEAAAAGVSAEEYLTHQKLVTSVHAFEGSVNFSVLIDEPPIRLLPPWGNAHAGSHANDTVATVCRAESGYRYYIGVVAAAGECSAYRIEVDLGLDTNCSTPKQMALTEDITVIKLLPHLSYADSCQAGEYKFYQVTLDAKRANHNLLFEVETRQELTSVHGSAFHLIFRSFTSLDDFVWLLFFAYRCNWH